MDAAAIEVVYCYCPVVFCISEAQTDLSHSVFHVAPLVVCEGYLWRCGIGLVDLADGVASFGYGVADSDGQLDLAGSVVAREVYCLAVVDTGDSLNAVGLVGL